MEKSVDGQTCIQSSSNTFSNNKSFPSEELSVSYNLNQHNKHKQPSDKKDRFIRLSNTSPAHSTSNSSLLYSGEKSSPFTPNSPSPNQLIGRASTPDQRSSIDLIEGKNESNRFSSSVPNSSSISVSDSDAAHTSLINNSSCNHVTEGGNEIEFSSDGSNSLNEKNILSQSSHSYPQSIHHNLIPANDFTNNCISVPSPRRQSLSSVVGCLVNRWSREYVCAAQSGDVDSMLLVAQMFVEGYGEISPSEIEGRKWLSKARQAGGSAVESVVKQLEHLYKQVPQTNDKFYSAPTLSVNTNQCNRSDETSKSSYVSSSLLSFNSPQLASDGYGTSGSSNASNASTPHFQSAKTKNGLDDNNRPAVVTNTITRSVPPSPMCVRTIDTTNTNNSTSSSFLSLLAFAFSPSSNGQSNNQSSFDQYSSSMRIPRLFRSLSHDSVALFGHERDQAQQEQHEHQHQPDQHNVDISTDHHIPRSSRNNNPTYDLQSSIARVSAS